MDDDLKKDEWLRRVLGVEARRPSSVLPPVMRKPVRAVPLNTSLPHPAGAIQIPLGRPRSGAAIAPAAKPVAFVAPSGKKISVAKLPGGAVSYTAPPPPVKEVTFSGGGGKGVALPGAVKALEDSGVLKDARKIAGASVGSMTAALVAAGITSEEFTRIGNDDETTARIVEGTGGTKLGLLVRAMKNIGSPLTGGGLEDIVRDVLDETLRKRIVEYMDACGQRGEAPDPTAVAIVKRLASNKSGPTFGDLRQLSRVIPAIKEVVITGTYIKEFETNDKGKLSAVEGSGQGGQLYVFDADSEPDLEVAIAVHASASFPAAFKPVDIKLANGRTVRFIDGGVMNNTPTSSTLGQDERDLDPVPSGRGVTFVFEDKAGVADDLLAGKVKPEVGRMARLIDWFVGSEHIAAEYAKNRDLADKPEELVVVPLQITLPPKKPGGKEREVDMRGGTLEFNLPMEAKLALQQATEQATQTQIEREKQDRSRSFSCESQMLCCIPMDELQTLQSNDYEGAAAAVVFRERVAEMIAKLLDAVRQPAAKADPASLLNDPMATGLLNELDRLAGADADYQAFVARELNKQQALDAFLSAARQGGRSSPALAATYAVSDMLKVRAHADALLKELVYPQMKYQNKGGSGIETLQAMEQKLRAAKTVKALNAAIDMGVKHFKSKSDRSIPKRGHKKFAAALAQRKMK
ncbi:patatin-like phospholipase family protein [Paucibacter sp. R3-3]|uniref:Patatin-like phospholipase family protein n=1 Tax=Roseateles agri TaxID=3098619 RepID=A0ABU5DFJ0_9BURK|nr:patatin-like phospholipase family protein [Paucibacter sp. R3-3]MDY0745052.1 patatin-like phospholipase family protein [Paucibacter sp. R3-3]